MTWPSLAFLISKQTFDSNVDTHPDLLLMTTANKINRSLLRSIYSPRCTRQNIPPAKIIFAKAIRNGRKFN